MKIEIQGQDAVRATEELLAIEGIEGSYQTVDEVERGEPLTTIAAIFGIASATVTIAKAIYEWYQKYQNSRQNLTGAKIEKVLIVTADGRRLLLKDTTTLKQIQAILEKSE
ncbi:hypothetical protein [Nostoc punctiforme]|uniref:Uncharacterized protein n=1 Tax=Nostoc punctiforme (strain ATCC 29133 / PCC 73102) TaxID=63737 RepID=B2JB80_NOSP7|nr:hypothetical protein [Nostoc punctiforme]ACC85184.1 conserved hypothetical protein [Nostoc punctiforme PCC 73102]